MERNREPTVSIRTKNDKKHVLVNENGFATGKGFFLAFVIGMVAIGLLSGVGWLIFVLTGWHHAIAIGGSIGVLFMFFMLWITTAFEP